VLIFKVLHIISMVTMITVFSGGEFFVAFAVWRRDVHAVAIIHRLEVQSRAPQVGLAALVAGIVFGLLTAATGGLDFFAGWLLVPYGLVALFFVNIAVLGLRVIPLMEAAAEAERGNVRSRR
jgi:uncharacterized membrane protein